MTPQQKEAIRRQLARGIPYPNTLPEDRHNFLAAITPSREEYLKAQARRNHQTESSDLVYNPVLSIFQKRNQRS